MHTPKTKGGPAGNTRTALRQIESLHLPAHGQARKSHRAPAQAQRPEASPPGPALARPDPGPWPSAIMRARFHVLCLPVNIAARLGPQPGLNTALALIPAILKEVRP